MHHQAGFNQLGIFRMIRFVVPDSGRFHVRIAWSALWECVCSVRVWQAPARHAPLRPWIRRPSAVRAGDLRLLAGLVREDGYIPDFLAPPPSGPNLSFQDEISHLRETAGEVVAAEVTRVAAVAAESGRAETFELLARFAHDPYGLRDAVADALERYWQEVIALEWPRFLALLEGEVLSRGRALALHGAGVVLGALHPAVAYRTGAIEVESPQQGEVSGMSSELLLVPSVFAWPDVFTVHDSAWRASIYYPARGVGTLWERPRAEPSGTGGPDRLVMLAGASRAKVLRAINYPSTTAELAAVLGTASPSISAHVQRLYEAGLLERTRVGRRVFYHRSSVGTALLTALDG